MKKILLASLVVLVALTTITVLFFIVRQALVRAEVKREEQVVPKSTFTVETTTHLDILPLYEEDRAKESFELGHGVSYLIRTDSATILMDLGNNPSESPKIPSLQNMQALGISWDDIDAIVISHPHPDHVGGVQAWQDKTLSFGNFTSNLSQMPIYAPNPITYSGTKLIHSTDPTLISNDIATTGMISYPEVFPIYLFSPKGTEQAVVINVAGKGLVLITGCGHPTMEKLVTRAETLFDRKVVGVVGGLHYEKTSAEDVKPHIQFLQPRQPKLVALSPHDSSPEALKAFQSAFPEAYQVLQVGRTIQFP